MVDESELQELAAKAEAEYAQAQFDARAACNLADIALATYMSAKADLLLLLLKPKVIRTLAE